MNKLEGLGHEERRRRLQQGFRGLSAPRGRRPISLRAIYWRVRAFSGLIVLALVAVPAVMAVSGNRGAGEVVFSSSYYANCADARAAGVAPLSNDQSGYRPQLDVDGDGLACEVFGW